jgi:hypothetical protein
MNALLLLLLAVAVASTQARLRKYMSEVCLLTGMPTRDKAEAHIFRTTSTQKCYLYSGAGGTPGHATFSLISEDTDKNMVWRTESANKLITSADLDKGTATNSQSYAYIHQLDDTQSSANPTGTAVAGQVLGAKLGGTNDVQNLFPQSTLYQSEYQAIETEIYDCLKNNYASKALLEWTFLYQTSTALRPYLVYYHVSFTAATGATTTCGNKEHHIKN